MFFILFCLLLFGFSAFSISLRMSPLMASASCKCKHSLALAHKFGILRYTTNVATYGFGEQGHKKSVKFTCSSRSSRASQSPLKVEKQPKSTPDMPTFPHPIRAWKGIIKTYPRGHSLLLFGLLTMNFAKILMSRKQRQ